MTDDGPVVTLINKRIRGLRKKLKRIAQLEESVIAHGKSAIKNKDQQQLLKSKPAIVAAVEELEKFRHHPNLSPAIDEEINLAIQHCQSENNNGYKEVDHHNTIITYNKTTDNEQNTKSTDSRVIEDLLSLIYLGSLFDVKSQGDFSSIMLTRTHERKYVTDDDDVMLGEKDLELISMMSSLLISSSRPADSSVNFSHLNALQRCIQHAKLWLAKSEQPIDSNSSDVTYASLGEMLAKIMGSDYFFKITPEINIKATDAHVAAEAGYGFQVPVQQSYVMPDYLCEELIFEILTRLPSKSLIRFRSLSKSLCFCIDSPDFIRLHTSRSPQKVLIQHAVYGYFCKYLYTLHAENLLPTSHKEYIGIKPMAPSYYSKCVSSCNGIVCLIDHEDSITLWNPSIGRTLPYKIQIEGGRRKIGFGFDSITDDYKIVSIPVCGGFGLPSYVYTVKTDAWSEITSPYSSFCEVVTSHGCFVNGSLHWVVQFRVRQLDDGYYTRTFSHHILTFNLSTHVFGMIALPEPSWKTRQLTIIQGSLAVISSKDGYSCIWVMREYNNAVSWSFFKRKRNSWDGGLRRVLQPWSNSDLLLFSTESGSFQVYDTKVRAQPSLWNLDADSKITEMETYVESLHLFNIS